MTISVQITEKAAEIERFADALDAKGAPSTDDIAKLKAMMGDLTQLKAAAAKDDARSFARALGSSGGSSSTSVLRGVTARDSWAEEVADRLTKTVGEFGVKAITAGGIDIPQVVESVVTMPVEPTRVLDLLVNRKPLTGNSFEFLRQTVRNNLAATVADNAAKPVSVYTFEEIEDRARVFAHLSEPIPLRYLDDHAEIKNVLQSQMAEDLMNVIEENVLIGDGLGENFTGLSITVGVQAQAFTTDVLTTLRKARTKLVTSGETPTGWVLNHADLESLDLTRENGATGGFMDVDKIFGGLPRVGSSIIPAGFAYLGDWSQARLYVREGGRLDADVSGALFDANQVKLRYEGRFGLAVLRPAAFVKIDLTV